ncbi:putative cytoplasmic protein [Hyaloraphidium curvatum]|nr:putative cytoplasmic protein [Hyaloraphidium curvatum]
MPINAIAFAATLKKNAGDRSTGMCAQAVRLALEAAGAAKKVPVGSAKDYGPRLEEWGFTTTEATKDGSLQVGDVAVIQSPDGKHPHGHIQGYDGTQWISDFKQKQFWPGPAYAAAEPDYVIYRYIVASAGQSA